LFLALVGDIRYSYYFALFKSLFFFSKNTQKFELRISNRKAFYALIHSDKAVRYPSQAVQLKVDYYYYYVTIRYP